MKNGAGSSRAAPHSVANTILANDFPTAGANLNYTLFGGGSAPIVPQTTDPAKLALYTADGLTPGSPFPGNVIPANLMDPNAVLEVNAGTFPKPNLGNGTSTLPRFPPPTTFVKKRSASTTPSTASSS